MTFSSGLPTVLKQEPQTDQLKVNKNSLSLHQDQGNLSIANKNDKSSVNNAASTVSGHIEPIGEKHNKNDLIENGICPCSPPNSQQILESNINNNNNKVNNNINGEQSKFLNLFVFSLNKNYFFLIIVKISNVIVVCTCIFLFINDFLIESIKSYYFYYFIDSFNTYFKCVFSFYTQ